MRRLGRRSPPGVSRADLDAVRASNLFDAAWYAGRHPDVALSGLDPAEHYLWLGHRLGRSPSPRFDARAYLAANDDVARAGSEPLLHYLRWGRAEGRWAVPLAASPDLLAPPRPAAPGSSGPRPAGGARPTLNWVTNPDNAGWAYGNNARLLAGWMPGFEHRFDAAGEVTAAALYFDIRIFQMRGRSAARNVLRVGGPRPIELAYGADLARLRADVAGFDAVIVLSRALLATFAPLHPNVHLIPNALDLEAWRPGPRPDAEPGRRLTLGFAGNLQTARERELKGFDLAEVAARAAGADLLTLAKGEGQIPREEMPGRFFGRIDALLHPVAPGKEGCSNVIMEALALGVPVITTRDAGYHAELIADGEGLLFCERDEADMARAIRRLQEDPGLRRAMSEEGRRFAEAHHDVRRAAPLYARLLDPRPAADGRHVALVPFWSPPEAFASSRLRCLQPARLLAGDGVRAEVAPVPPPGADAAIVSQLASDATMAALAADPGMPVAYDLCDRYFDDERTVGGVPAKARFGELARRAEVIVTSTLALKREVAGLGLERAVVHLPDGIDYGAGALAPPSDPDGPLIWFGNPGRGNFDSARWMIDWARGQGRPVRLVSRRGHFVHLARTQDPAFGAYADLCEDWAEATFPDRLRACSVALLASAPEEPGKSPNRLVTAAAHGVPAVVAGLPAAAALLRRAGLSWAVVEDEAGLAAALDRLAQAPERARYLNRLQPLVDAEAGPEALRARYAALLEQHLPPRLDRADPLRVLFVSHNLNQGEGAPTSLLQTVTGLARTGRVEAAVFSVLPGELAQGYEEAGVPVVIPELGAQSRLASRTISLSGPHLQEAFRATLRERRTELVVVNTATALWFADLAQEEGLPTLAMIRESSPEHVDFAFGPEEVMAACRRGLARADRVVFVSEHTRRLWAASHALDHAATIPNGIDLARLGAAWGEGRDALRARLGLAPGEVAILSVGSVSARKAQGDIVAALASLPPDLAARTRLLLVGAKPSAYLESLRAQVAALPGDLASRVRIEPETPDVGAWYRAADLFVLASRNESYPRVVVEALSFGLPVVSSAVFGTREQVVDGVSGLLFEPGDVPALARHLARLLGDEGLRRAMSEAAEARAWELVTYWEMVHRYDVLLRRIMAERAARP